MRAAAERVKFDDALVAYLLAIVRRDARARRARLGVSPRGALALRRAAQARALVDGRDYCIPEDVRDLAVAVLAHRVLLDPRGGRAARPARRPSGSCARSSSGCRSRSERALRATAPSRRARGAPPRGAAPAPLRCAPPRTLRPTRAGWLFFALTFGVGFAALNTGQQPALPGAVAACSRFLVLSGVLSEAALRGIGVRRRLPARVFAGGVRRASRSRSRTPSGACRAYALVVEDLVRERGGIDARRARSRLRAAHRAGRAPSAQLPLPTARGAGPLRFTRLPRLDALSVRPLREVAASSRRRSERSSIPALDRRHGAARLGAAARSRARSATARRGPAPRPTGLRDFARGDPARAHPLARVVRGAARCWCADRERERRAPRSSVLLRTRGRPGDDASSSACARAASEAVAHLDAGLRVGARAPTARASTRPRRAPARALLAFLARVEPSDVAPARPREPRRAFRSRSTPRGRPRRS